MIDEWKTTRHECFARPSPSLRRNEGSALVDGRRRHRRGGHRCRGTGRCDLALSEFEAILILPHHRRITDRPPRQSGRHRRLLRPPPQRRFDHHVNDCPASRHELGGGRRPQCFRRHRPGGTNGRWPSAGWLRGEWHWNASSNIAVGGPSQIYYGPDGLPAAHTLAASLNGPVTDIANPMLGDNNLIMWVANAELTVTATTS